MRYGLDFYKNRLLKMKVKVIRNLRNEPYLARYNIFECFGFSAKIHLFFSSDEDRALHSHPFYFFGIILSPPGYLEHTERGTFHRKWLHVSFQKPNYFHRVELFKYDKDDADAQGSFEKPVLTLFCTYKPRKELSWSFRCPHGDKDFKDFNKDNGCE
jgi:hypothetical protein